MVLFINIIKQIKTSNSIFFYAVYYFYKLFYELSSYVRSIHLQAVHIQSLRRLYETFYPFNSHKYRCT